jgi:hypothetical protein
VLGLGLVAFLGLLTEGAMGDWSAVYLHHTLGATSAVAALGFAAFSLTMAAGRFAGDALVARLGDAEVVRRFTGGAALVLGLALAVGTPWAAIAGFAAVGFGVANLIPIVFRAASRLRGVAPSEGIAAVGTFGYVGFLSGPAAHRRRRRAGSRCRSRSGSSSPRSAGSRSPPRDRHGRRAGATPANRSVARVAVDD